MYIPPGFWSSEMGDIDVIVHENRIHVFYLCAPSHDRVAHIVSSDGLFWQEEVTALRTGNPGEFDDDHIWTMGVFKLKNKFFMLYTGLSSRERGKIQRVGVAVSDDLNHWNKYDKNPVIEADPRWYEAICDDTNRIDWRDPKVWVEDGIAHGVICARSNKGAENRRGCVGYFTSRDGFNWKVKPPLPVLGNCYEFETPALFKLDKNYYLTGINGNQFNQIAPNIYRVAKSLAGPYLRKANDQLLPADNMVFKPCVWQGEQLLFHNLRGIGDWSGAEGLPIHTLAPPKAVATTSDGSLILRPFKGWKTAAEDNWREIAASPCTGCEFGINFNIFNGKFANFIFEAEIQLKDAKEFGVFFRTDNAIEEGSFVSLQPGRARISIYTAKRRLKNSSVGVIYGTRPQVMIQENHLAIAPEGLYNIRLTAFGPYIEFSINNQVVLSALSWLRKEGCLGLFAEDGNIVSSKTRIKSLRF